MRAGQPKCVCAPKCKTKNQRPKRGNHHAHSQLKINHHGLKRHANDHNWPNQSDENHRQSIQSDIDTSPYVQIFDHRNNQSHAKSDKIISIIAPIHSNPSNLSSSHRSKKIKLHNGNRQTIESARHSVASHNSQWHHSAKQHQSGINRRHKLSHQNEYSSNSSTLFDNNVSNVNHRRQASVEEQFKSKFYGHDIPYPPIDLPVS